MEDEKKPKRETPFSKGNTWRFTSSKQPPKHTTPKQAIKMLESLLLMSEKDVNEIGKNEESPVFLKKSALMLIDGNVKEVVELINAYKHGIF